MHTTPLCNQPIIDIQPTCVVSLVHTNEPVLEIVIDFAVFSCCCLFLFKPLFSYWNCAQCLAVVFIWSTCLVTDCLYRFRWVFRSICTDIVFLPHFSEHLFSYIFVLSFFGASVLISFCLGFLLPEHLLSYRFFWVFSEHLFSYRFFLDFFSAHLFSYRFWLVYFGTSVLLLEVGILFSCFFCYFQSTRLYRLRWFLAEHVFSFWRLVSFLPGFFPEHVFPGYKFVSCSLVFVEARAPILEAWSTCFLTGRVYRLRWGVFRSTCSHIICSVFFRSIFSHTWSLYRFSRFLGHVFPGYKFVAFSSGWYQNLTQRKLPTYSKSLTQFIT